MADVSRHLVIDGSNIATEGRSLPSLGQLDEAVRAFVKERPHETWTVVVDATFGHRIEASEKPVYEEALAANELVTPPAGTIGRGDKFLLEIADRSGATVFSNDSFQEFHGEYDWLFDEGRLVGGKPVPEVGWIFTERTPVRGPKSRMATRGGGDRRGRLSAAGRSGGTRRVLSATASGPPPVPTMPPPRPPRREPVRATKVEASAPPAREPAETEGEVASPPRRRPSSSPKAVNEPLPFIEFIAEHGPGQEVEGEVLTFTSHGAFVQVGGTRCYLALKFMGDPAPRSARDVLHRGEVRTFIVQAIDAPRRGIDLAMPGFEAVDAAHAPVQATTPAAEAASESAATGAVPVADRPSRARRVRPVAAPGPEGPDVVSTDALVDAAAADIASDSGTVAKKATTKKATTRKTAAKKATTRKTAAKKSAAKRVVVKKAQAEEVAATEVPMPEGAAEEAASTERAVPTKATARKAAPKSSTARKAAPKKAAPRKVTAKEATATKAATKKAAAKKATTKKATTKKATTKKATTKKATTKRATTKRAMSPKAAPGEAAASVADVEVIGAEPTSEDG